MSRGRKADKGTYEAREKIILICNKIEMIAGLSTDAKRRTIKALKFGLGIKEENTSTIEQTEMSISPIKENTDHTKKDVVNGDDYFKPEDCYTAN